MIHLGWALVWKWSAAALLAGNSLDSASSLGRLELNPLLAQHGQFTVRSAVIKTAVVSTVLVLQRRHRSRAFVITNLAGAAVLSGAAIHNWRQR